MEVLFLGAVFDDSLEKEIIEKSLGVVHYAANKLQWNIIDGLLENDELNLEILSAPFIGTYPKDYVDFIFKGKKSIYKEIVESNYITFNNLWGYRSISRKNNLTKNIREFADRKIINKAIIVYSPHTPFLQAAVYAKKIDPSIHICLIVPDLPQFMNLDENRSLAYDTLKRIDIAVFNKNSQFVDSFVLLTEPMKEMLNIGDRPFVVIEGVVNKKSDSSINPKQNYSSKNCMTAVYTGTLNKKFGIVNLVKAFYKNKVDNTLLLICGRGDSEDIIQEYASKDHRIKYLGQLTNKQAVELQKKATVLINPRQNNEEFTKYSFPSKNMEYLLTGRPVIAYKLDGIPNDYDDYIFYVEDNSIDTFTKKIEEVMLMDESKRNEFGEKAKIYVLSEKNNISASGKILDMIRESKK